METIAPYMTCIEIGVDELTSWVNRLKKNSVALGFKALFMKPILNDFASVIVLLFFLYPVSCTLDLFRRQQTPK